MDPVSQGALGAAAAQVVAAPGHRRVAAVLGALSGMAPDLDVLIRSSTDPLLFLEYHRQFTHSFAFLPLGGLLCALIAFPFVRGRLPFASLFGFCLAGYATHGLLDACTSYGTQLAWPFSTLRVAWNVVPVVDPLFTLLLLAAAVAAAVRRSRRLAVIALVWALAYPGVGALQRDRARAVAADVAAARGHDAVLVYAKPAFGNIVLWKTYYRHGGRVWVDAVRLGLEARVYEGESIAALDGTRDLPWLEAGTMQARDLERFWWFSDGFLGLDPDDPGRVIDVRYSMVPDRIEALWGIELSADAPDGAHARFFTEREPTADEREALVAMVLGHPRPAASQESP